LNRLSYGGARLCGRRPCSVGAAFQMIQYLSDHHRIFNTVDRFNRATVLITDIGINVKYRLY
jgi:hypothetical protein